MFQMKMLPSSPTEVNCLSSGLKLLRAAGRGRAATKGKGIYGGPFRSVDGNNEQHFDQVHSLESLVTSLSGIEWNRGKYSTRLVHST